MPLSCLMSRRNAWIQKCIRERAPPASSLRPAHWAFLMAYSLFAIQGHPPIHVMDAISQVKVAVQGIMFMSVVM